MLDIWEQCKDSRVTLLPPVPRSHSETAPLVNDVASLLEVATYRYLMSFIGELSTDLNTLTVISPSHVTEKKGQPKF